MTDTPVVMPLATVPTRPVQDGIIDPVWGQWVHDHIANIGNPNGGLLVAGVVDFAPVESGEVGATAVAVRRAANVPVVAGHAYRVELLGSIVNRTGTGGAGGVAYVNVFAAGTTSPLVANINQREVYLHAANVVMPVDQSGYFFPTVTQNVDVTYFLAKTWWAANPVRFIITASNPGALMVTDLGLR